MHITLTVMGPADTGLTQYLASPNFNPNCDKLSWRKDVRCWASTVRACADGGDGRAKAMLAALRMFLFRSFSPSRRQMVEKINEAGDLILDPLNHHCSNNMMQVINVIINIVAEDTAPDAVKLLSRLSKKATSYTRRRNESMTAYIERFLLPAQKYLNLVNSDKQSAESQNLATILLSNANLSPQTFSSVLSSLVTLTKSRDHTRRNHISFEIKNVARTIAIFSKLLDSTTPSPALNKHDKSYLKTSNHSLKLHYHDIVWQ